MIVVFNAGQTELKLWNGLMNRSFTKYAFIAIFMSQCLYHSAKAGFVLVTTRAGLNETGQFNLANLGPAGTILPTSNNLTANTGEVATVSQNPSAAPARVDQSAPVYGWEGNFLPGTALIKTNYGGPVTFDFGSTQLSSFGLQIQPDIYGRFTAYISVLNASNVEIARFSQGGVSSLNADGTALFVGIAATDSASNFSKIRVGIQTGGNLFNFAYNSPAFASVPEPGTVILAGISAGLLILVKKRRSRKAITG